MNTSHSSETNAKNPPLLTVIAALQLSAKRHAAISGEGNKKLSAWRRSADIDRGRSPSRTLSGRDIIYPVSSFHCVRFERDGPYRTKHLTPLPIPSPRSRIFFRLGSTPSSSSRLPSSRRRPKIRVPIRHAHGGCSAPGRVESPGRLVV